MIISVDEGITLQLSRPIQITSAMQRNLLHHMNTYLIQVFDV